ncbi:isoprenylcysteine carboxylmethyltransferase family protein [Nocardia sp. NBC_01503]|uniref:methyltransferase family protein n=1 Tax=Nocardia sp. NBC_01503 TaxID=2975997 RepID=UPI002E7B1F36|nr:isoprenylcysteine carboxylmethyltransferase family protein [Nocardia sp. NBC_01503]WTL30443.1 isoprenylcysteine carboxylmethyltransferase family protein [Nocardia sp. NBC_01503]
MVIIQLLPAAALASLQVVGIVWLATAVWFAVRRAGTPRDKLWHFARTLLPEPWMLLGLTVLIVIMNLLPGGIWETTTWTNPALAEVGSVFVIGSAALMVWARLALGTMWAGRPMIQQEHELRTGGPYQVVRHPIYTGILGVMTGRMLMAGFGATVVTFVFILGWLLWRVREEDRILIDTFGDRYRSYQQEVGALIPIPRRDQVRPRSELRKSPPSQPI